MVFTKAAVATTIFFFAGCTFCFPSFASPKDLEARQNTHPYILNDNNPNAVRAPCPGHNTLANHGYINRNGICITRQAVQQGFLDAFNMDFTVTDPGVTNTFNLCQSLNGGRPCTCFNLDMLATPHQIEHDGSLSRRDREMIGNLNADNQRFNQTIWDRTLEVYGADPHIGVAFANTAREIRVAQAKKADAPGWFIENPGGSTAEHAFILSTMNDPALGVNLNTPGANPMARMDWVNHWFVNMELPTALGWHKPTQTITGNNINSLAAAIQNAPIVTAQPRGQSPYESFPHPPPIPIRKRTLQEPKDTRNMMKRDVEAGREYIRALIDELEDRDLPQFNERGVPSTAVASAAAKASALAPPPPALPNAYFEYVAPQTFTGLRAATMQYKATVQGLFDQALSNATST